MDEITFLCKFDSDGNRGETHDTAGMSDEDKQAKLDDGFIEITAEQWHYLVGNRGKGDNGTGYIFDVENKQVKSAPAISKDELIKRKKAVLDYEYQTSKAELLKQYSEALAYSDTDSAETIQEQLNELDEQYDTAYTTIEED